MTQTVRRYPRDIEVGTRIAVRVMTSRGSKARPATVEELTQVGNRYRIVALLDRNADRVRMNVAANAKLDTIR